MKMIKRPLKSVGTGGSPDQHNEQGSVLVYALIVITFLSGLAAYLQTMSDPMIFQTKATQQILSTEYLADSLENIIPELCEGDSEFINTAGTTINRPLVAKLVDKYSSIYLYRSSERLIGTAKLESSVTESNFDEPQWTQGSATVTVSGDVNYNIQYFNVIKVTENVMLHIKK